MHSDHVPRVEHQLARQARAHLVELADNFEPFLAENGDFVAISELRRRKESNSEIANRVFPFDGSLPQDCLLGVVTPNAVALVQIRHSTAWVQIRDFLFDILRRLLALY